MNNSDYVNQLLGSQRWGFSFSEMIGRVNVQCFKHFRHLNSYVKDFMGLGECGRYPLCVDNAN